MKKIRYGSEPFHNCRYCGEKDPTKFYGRRRDSCKICHNKDVLKRGQEKREWAITQLGGCCKLCGYKNYLGALDIHHIDPAMKDKNFTSMRGWSKERISKEIENCVALCKVCHVEVHAGVKKI